MLVLTRKCSEMIQIGENVVVKVIRTGRNSVKIGIQAPSHVRVLRAELSEKEGTSETSEETDKSSHQSKKELPAVQNSSPEEADLPPERTHLEQLELTYQLC